MTMLAALAVLLLAVGLASCGGGSDNSSSTTNSGASGQVDGKSSSSTTNGAAEGKAGGSQAQSGGSAADFTPKHHNDSGGGSAQFEVKGGDNSVQEFGEEAGSAEFEAAAAVVHDFLDARAEGNWAAACTYMSKATIKSFETIASRSKQGKDLSCGAILAGLINPAAKPDLKAEAEKADVGSLRVEGERAFVIYTGVDGTTIAMPMANEGGEWKVAALAGAPLG
jgi:hypothetical protein